MVPGDGDARVRWLHAPEPWPTDGSIAILDPGDPIRRARWERVLDDYGVCAFDAPAPVGAHPPTGPARRDFVVVAVHGPRASYDPEPLASALAAATCRTLVRLGDLHELHGLAEGWSRPTDVVVVASPPDLSAAVVDEVVQRLEARGHVVGLVTARDLPGLSFVVAKLRCLPRDADRPRVGVVDAIRRRIGTLDAMEPLTGERLRATLDAGWDALVVSAHGEGGHINLHDVVLCGLTTPEERSLDGSPLAGGCALPDHCKRRRAPEIDVRHPAELRAQILVLDACTSFAVDGELYPSTVSLMLDALDGHAAVVVGTTRLVESTIAIEPFDAALLRGAPGRLTAAWNERYAGLRPRTHYVLCGLPTPWPPEAVADPMPTLAPSVDEQWPTLTGELASVLARAHHAAAFEAGTEVALERREADAESISLLAVLRQLRELVVLRARVAARTLAEGRRGAEARVELEHHVEGLAQVIATWDEAVAALTARSLVDKAIFEVLHHHHVLAAIEAAADCPRCGVATERLGYVSIDAGLGPRSARQCRFCGPLGEWRDDGARLELRVEGPLRAGGSVDLVLDWTDPAPSWCRAPAYVVVEGTDKATGRGFYRSLHRTTAAAAALRITVELPATLSRDLHTFRAAYVHAMDVAYARVRNSH